MASHYHVRIYCETCGEYKYTTQDVIDDTWKPAGCAGHTTRDFTVGDCGCIPILDGCSLELFDDDSSACVSLRAPAEVEADVVFHLPGVDVAGVLVSDGEGNWSFKSAIQVDGENVVIVGTLACGAITSTGLVTGTQLKLTAGQSIEMAGGANAITAADTSAVICRTGGGGAAPFDQSGSLYYRPRLSDTAGRGGHYFYVGATPILGMHIGEAGHVGIGVISTNPLHVLTAVAGWTAWIENTHATAGDGLYVKDGNDGSDYIYAGADKDGTLRFRVMADGKGGSDDTWAEFSPVIGKDNATPDDYLDWALEDALKPHKPYKGLWDGIDKRVRREDGTIETITPDNSERIAAGITSAQDEMDKYGKSGTKIAIGTARWADHARGQITLATSEREAMQERIKELENKIAVLEGK